MECPHIHIENVEVMCKQCGGYVDDVEVMCMLCGGYVDDVNPHCGVSTCPHWTLDESL